MQRESKRQQQQIAPVPQPRLQRRTETPDNTAQQAARADQQAARQANYASFIQCFATTPEASLATDILSTQAPITDHHSAARALPGVQRVRLQRLLQSQHVARSLSLGREALNPVQRASDQTVEDLTGLPLQRAAAPTANLETRLQRHRDAKASLQPAVLEPSLAPRSTQLEVQRTPLEGRSPRLSVQRADDGQNQLGHSSPNLGRNVQRSPAHSDAVNEHISTAQTARVQRQRAVTARAGEMKAQMLSTQVQRLRAPDAPNLEPSGKAYTLTGQAERINTELPIMRAKHNHDPAYLDGDTKPVTDFSRHVGLSLGRQYHVQRTKSGARPRDLSAVISRVHDAHDRANLLTSTLMTFNPNDREAASVQRLVAERENELELQRQTLETDLEPVTQRLAEREAEHPENLSAMIARAGGGEELPEKVKRQLQPQFNFSLDIVRIHRDGYADMLAKTVNAIAFTTGTSIFFRSGKFDPSSSSGRGLLVHELTHVGQQLAGLVGKGIDEGQEDSPHEGAAAKAGAIEEAKGALPEPAARDAVESWGVSNGMGAQQVAGGTSVLQRTPDKPRGKKSKRTSGSSKIIKKESVSSYLEVKYTFNIDPARIFTTKGFKDIKLYHLTTADMEGMQRAYQEKYENSLRFITFPDQKDGKSKHYVFLKNAQRNIFKVDADSKPRNILPEKVSGSENKVGTEVENKTKSGMPGDGTSVQLPRGSRNLRQEIISLMRRKALDLLEKSEVEVDKLLEDVNDESFESKVLKPEVRQKFAKAAKEVVRINGAIERIENNLAKTSNTYKNNIGRIINLRDPKVINSSMKDNSSTSVESLTTEKMRERELIAKELEEDNFLIANKVIKPSQEALDLLRKVKVSASSIHSLLYSASSDDLEFYKRNPLYNTDVDNTLGRMRTRLKEIQTNIITTRENIADDSFLWSVDGLFESSVKDVNFSDSDRKEIRDIRSSEQVVKNLKSFAWTFLELGFTAGAIVFGGPLGFAFAVLSFTSSTYDAVDDVQKFYRDKAAANTDPNGEKSLIPKTPDEIQLQGILAFLSVVGTAADGLDVLDAAKFLGEIKTAVKEKDIPEYLTSQVKKESSEISPSSVGKNPAGEGMEKSGSGVPAPTKEIGVEKTDSTISVSEMKTQNPSTPDSGPPTTPKNLKTPAKSIPPKPKSITGYRESLHEELGSNWKSWVKSRVAKARAAAKDKNIRIPRNISREELACLQDYTTSSYQRINNALRFEKEIPISAKDKLIIALAESARKKFPTFEGTVYRGVSSGDWLDQYTVGATVSDEAFLSTTSMSGRQSLGDTLITIKNSKGGHDISSISRGSGVNEEGEILFKPGAKFKVISDVELGKDIKKAPYPHPQSQDVLVTREIVLEPVPERSLKKPDKKPKKSKENLKDLEKNFVGKEAGEANLPPGYRYAEIGNAKYAYLETSDTTKVPLLKADRKGNWYVPKSSSYRVADTKRYTTNYGKKTLETRSQIHHLIADNLWRRTPILQEILRRGIADMDLKPNLIELGEKMEDIARAKAIDPHFPEIPHLAGHPIYDQIANKILEDFVDAAMIKNEKIDVLKFTNQELLDTLKLAQDEILRLLRDEPDRFPRKLDGSLAQLESPDTTNASMTGEV